MKIYIVGPVASGKSTLAKRLSGMLSIPFQSLDEVVHVTDMSSPQGNCKRSPEERDSLFYDFIARPCWIVEDVGRRCFEEGFKRADILLLLDIPSSLRDFRIIKRWIKQRLGLEKCLYLPSLKMLKCMLQWSRNYDKGKDKLKERLAPYQEKTLILRNRADIQRYLEQTARQVLHSKPHSF